MFLRQSFGCFHLDDQTVVHKEVCAVVANERAVLFVVNLGWRLLFHVQAQLPEPMGQRVLIDLFQVAVLVRGSVPGN